MPTTCDFFTELWQYDFKVKWANTDMYVRVPLATFATDFYSTELDYQTCAIMV